MEKIDLYDILLSISNCNDIGELEKAKNILRLTIKAIQIKEQELLEKQILKTS